MARLYEARRIGMMEEVLDYFDEKDRWVGTAGRKEIHTKGLWHRTFHCWIVGSKHTLLFQKRHESKDVFPGKLDKSAAGHLLAGETPEDGLRELEEELGIYPQLHELSFCGTVRVENDTSGLVDREVCYVYLLRSDKPVQTYKIQTSEVSGLYEVGIDDYELLVNGQLESIQASGAAWDERKETFVPTSFDAVATDFTPQNEAYYDLLFRSIERLNNSF